MLLRRRLLESENHLGGESVGEANPLVRADFEDALVQALEDCYQDSKIEPLRNCMRKNKDQWPADFRELVLTQDPWAWYTLYFLTCTLRRMAPRWEHAANKLMHEFGMDPQQIPAGNEWLYR